MCAGVCVCATGVDDVFVFFDTFVQSEGTSRRLRARARRAMTPWVRHGSAVVRRDEHRRDSDEIEQPPSRIDSHMSRMANEVGDCRQT